jgi:hypothetical protein
MLAQRFPILLWTVIGSLLVVSGCVPTQPSGQLESSPGVGSDGTQEAQTQVKQPENTVMYTDSTYKFSVSYPSDFVSRTQPAEKLAQLLPKPNASFIFMNPVTASSDIAEFEPADLEIRVYAAGQVTSLESWLTSNGLAPKDTTTAFQSFKTTEVSGVQLCGSTMIAPGCSYFVLGRDWIYQLTPATPEGEGMVNTFMLIP